MPTYEYRCRDCGHTFDIVQKMSDDPLTHCPECGGDLRKVFAPPAISFGKHDAIPADDDFWSWREAMYRATNRQELQSIYSDIDRLEKTEVKLRRFTTFRPLFQWPLLAAFGLLALELGLANTRYRRVP